MGRRWSRFKPLPPQLNTWMRATPCRKQYANSRCRRGLRQQIGASAWLADTTVLQYTVTIKVVVSTKKKSKCMPMVNSLGTNSGSCSLFTPFTGKHPGKPRRTCILVVPNTCFCLSISLHTIFHINEHKLEIVPSCQLIMLHKESIVVSTFCPCHQTMYTIRLEQGIT